MNILKWILLNPFCRDRQGLSGCNICVFCFSQQLRSSLPLWRDIFLRQRWQGASWQLWFARFPRFVVPVVFWIFYETVTLSFSSCVTILVMPNVVSCHNYAMTFLCLLPFSVWSKSAAWLCSRKIADESVEPRKKLNDVAFQRCVPYIIWLGCEGRPGSDMGRCKGKHGSDMGSCKGSCVTWEVAKENMGVTWEVAKEDVWRGNMGVTWEMKYCESMVRKCVEQTLS